MRTPTDLLINYTLKNAVNFICEKYGNKWLKSYEAIALEYDILNPYSNKVERITDSKSNNVDMSTSTDTDKIYGFDSDEGVNKDSSSNNAERTNDGETNTNETIIRTGNNGNTSMMVNSALQLAKNNLWSIILNDIKDELSLDIY
jgi:hypothetical protein